MKTRKIYLLLEVDTTEPENAVATYPMIGGHHLVNRLRDVSANGGGMLQRLMIRVILAQNFGERIVHFDGGEIAGDIKLVRADQMIIDV
jgi:hypothetical protein